MRIRSSFTVLALVAALSAATSPASAGPKVPGHLGASVRARAIRATQLERICLEVRQVPKPALRLGGLNGRVHALSGYSVRVGEGCDHAQYSVTGVLACAEG